jgi:hypothetical protein
MRWFSVEIRQELEPCSTRFIPGAVAAQGTSVSRSTCARSGHPERGVRAAQGPLVTRPWVVEDGYETVSEERSLLAFHIYGNSGDLRAADLPSGTDLQLRAHTVGDLVSQVAGTYGELPHAFTWIRAIQSLHAD